MSKKKTAAIVLAAGMGTRMKSAKPKVMHHIAGRPMVSHLLATLDAIKCEQTVVVVGPDMEDVERAVAPNPTAVQTDRLGTADAVKAGLAALGNFKGNILILYGDTPLITEQTLNAMLEARAEKSNPAVVVLGFEPVDPGEYGRLVTDDEDGELIKIVEAREATPDELAISLCNSGVMAVDGSLLGGFLARVNNNNAKGEYYLTDIVGLARDDGFSAAVVEGEEDELVGVNSRYELAQVETILQDRLRERAMKGGVTLVDPATVYFSFDTQIDPDTIVEPNVFFGPSVTIGKNAHIKAFSHIEGTFIGNGASVGPFARLRPGTNVGDGARVGNFVEIKNADIEQGAKVNHLSYVGDARVGSGANIGAGTITCNYDGFMKSHTDIGEGAFIGSNSALVAPVKIGDGAVVGAGSTITDDVPADALALARGQQKNIDGAAAKLREKKRALKEKNKQEKNKKG
ncbi:MAG: bifunctional UDP-N-acetylglucosamine diphosphorylase/glucosamine-1-phosphate N-acetyltransferase GlmU [Rhodospirillaceae bacterium]|nr:bifunctional UDP-N-acetylglucosamine diphosphorylase/glucosamine-1-phosphate N-acetyltransferase GlmU [Rhodospirillaceae bacterium]